MENVLLSDAARKIGERASCKINAIFFIHSFPMPQQRPLHTKKMWCVHRVSRVARPGHLGGF